MNLQRRNILRGGLAAALTLPVAGVQAVEYTKDLKWDKTADVVVLGYGGAGAYAFDDVCKCIVGHFLSRLYSIYLILVFYAAHSAERFVKPVAVRHLYGCYGSLQIVKESDRGALAFNKQAVDAVFTAKLVYLGKRRS